MLRYWISIACLCLCSLSVHAERPNIVFIMLDDLGKEWVGAYGGEGIETPNIDRLARAGMAFENAWSMPQCTPTRVTLLTGQYPFRHGWTNHWDVPRWGAGAHFDPRLNPSFPRVLREAGYQTAAAGKWQIDDFRVEPQAMREAGFDRWCMWTGYETGNPPSANRYWDPYIAMDGESKTHAGKFGPDVYTDFLIDFIHANRDEPMFLYFPMCLTHGPLTSTPDQPEPRGPEAFPGMVRYMDQLVGRLIAALDDAGVRDNTYIFFTTDNGTGMGQKNSRRGTVVRAGKTKMIEAGTAMPFIVTGPGIEAGTETDALVDFSDLAPTLLELAGAAMPEAYAVDGRSFAPLLRGEADDSPREWILSMGGSPAKLRDGRVVPKDRYDARVLRDKRYKVWVDGRGAITRLHDMHADPGEQANLLDQPLRSADEQAALDKFEAALATMPDEDAAPRYKANPPQPWDRKK
jgi:arylsulfatase A-like enzyme